MGLPAWMWKRQVWAFHTTVAGVAVTAVALLRLKPVWALGGAIVTIASATATRIWARRDPLPMPYAMRWILLAPRPFQSPRRLKALLGLQGGECLLEIGPGTGKYALPIAASLGPGGILEVLDIQQEMLDHLKRRVSQAGLGNILATAGDASRLPYADGTFDGGYLITVLGEIHDLDAALQELHRVLKPEGCLVIGEITVDPDFVPFAELQPRMASAGFTLGRKTGSPWAYLARFEKAEARVVQNSS